MNPVLQSKATPLLLFGGTVKPQINSSSWVSARIFLLYTSWRQIHETHEQKMLYGGYSHGETIPKRQYHSSRFISKTATKFWYVPLGCEDWNQKVLTGETAVTHHAQWQPLTYRNWTLLLPLKASGDSERAISEAKKEPIMTANEARQRLLQWALTSCHPSPCCVTRTRKCTSVSCQNCSVMFGLKLLWRCDPLWDFFLLK